MQVLRLVDSHHECFIRQAEQTLAIDKRSLKFLNLRAKARNFFSQCSKAGFEKGDSIVRRTQCGRTPYHYGTPILACAGIKPAAKGFTLMLVAAGFSPRRPHARMEPGS